MKKFLTVLLALSVVFTYSFSAMGSVFAAEKYTSTDYDTHFDDEWSTEYDLKLSLAEKAYMERQTMSEDTDLYGEGVLASDLGLKVLNSEDYPWTEYTFATAQAKIRADIVAAKGAYASYVKGEVFKNDTVTETAPTDYTIGLAKVYDKLGALTNVNIDSLMTFDPYYNAMAYTGYMEEAQEDSIYEAVIATLEKVNGDNYSAVNADKMLKEKADTLKAVYAKAGDDKVADIDKAKAYVEIFADFKAATKDIPTLDKEDLDEADVAAAVASAVAKFVDFGLGAGYSNTAQKANEPVNKWLAAAGDNIYVAGTGDTATVFGIAVADIDKVTTAEAAAINKAMRAAILDAADVVTVYANAIPVAEGTPLSDEIAARVKAVEELYMLEGGKYRSAIFLNSLNNAMEAADVYADVVAEGEALKDVVRFGIKVYDNAKVDAAVKAAENKVYADLKDGFDAAIDYLKPLSALEAENFEYKAFLKAQDEAQAKFINTPVYYGENKTAEEDLVYVRSTYATVEFGAWKTIADAACAEIEIAESYADIDAAMADAAAKMSELMLAKDETAVTAAIAKYQAALADDNKSAQDKMGLKDYTLESYNAAERAGSLLIATADNLAEAEAYYNEAANYFKGIPTKAELEAAKADVEKKIAALPSTSTLTEADLAAVVDALDAYIAFVNMYGCTDKDGNILYPVYNKSTLVADLGAVLRPAAKKLQEKTTAMEKEINKLDPTTDNGAAALVAYEDDIVALLAEIAEFNDLLDDAAVAGYTATADITTTLGSKLDAENAIWKAELHNLLAAANTANTAAEKKVVLDAYEKLTDRQKYKMEQNLKVLIEEIKADIIKSAETMKVRVWTKLYTGSDKIRVNWEPTGDTSAIDGYQVYKSTKAQKNYKFMGKTKKNYMDNKKNLKKGSRYYYKVRAYVDVDGERYFSDWSNKGNRIYK